MIVKPLPISWFSENLPEKQIAEDIFKEIIKKNYSLSWFTPIDTPVVERLDVLLAKWADDNEVYSVKRVNAESWEESEFWLRFDLTVPLARYVAQYEWELVFPFRRQHISRVYRWERPQKWRYREFYQADVDIIWNGNLPIFADVEVLLTIYNSLIDLKFWSFTININNKKFLSWLLESFWVENIADTISIIDKKDKVSRDKLTIMFWDIWLNEEKIKLILTFIDESETIDNVWLFSKYKDNENSLLQEWLEELNYIYNSLLKSWVLSDYIKINPTISRWLNYYTWTVFETFITWAESMWSISSGWRYENLASNFSKNNFPWVGGSIWLSRLIAVLETLWKFKTWAKTVSKVLLVNMWDDYLSDNLNLLKILRENNINSELYIDSKAKIQKQLKYANNKNIPFVIILWEEEIKNNIFLLKKLETGEQFNLSILDLINYLK